jgi:D-alanine-D-alanine ligase
MNRNKIAVIYGDLGSQKEVNIGHGDDIYEALKDDYNVQKFWLRQDGFEDFVDKLLKFKPDLIFNNSCGKFSGDGTIEGVFDILGLNYVGSELIATASCFDKKITKRIISSEEILVIKDLTIGLNDWRDNRASVLNRVKRKLGYPIVVKVVRGTDSIGMTVCRKEKETIQAINKAFREGDRIMLEQYVERKHEVTCFVLGNGKRLRPLDVVEYKFEEDILSEELKKRIDEVETIVPSRIPKKLYDKIQRLAMICHRILGCRDYSRTDFLIGKDLNIYFLETNAHAGLGVNSASTLSAKTRYGWSHREFIKRLVRIALSRKAA